MKEGGSHARQLALALGAIFFLAGTAMIGGSWWPRWIEHRHHRELAMRGTLALGTVISKARELDGSVSILGFAQPVIDYTIAFRFANRDGRQFTDHARVSAEEWDVLEVGGPIKVQYLPETPLVNRVPSALPRLGWLSTVTFSTVGALFVTMGVLTCYILLRQPAPDLGRRK